MEDFVENDISIPENVEVTEPLKIYLKEIEQIPPLSAQEEQELGRQLAAGDLNARRRMEESNLRLVVSIARLYTGHGVQFMDLIQEGNIGLMQAVEKFNFTEGSHFSTYAFPWIKEAIIDAIDEQSAEIRVPADVAESMQKVQRTANKLKQELGREAAFSEIAEFLGDKTAKEVENILALISNPASLETSAKEGKVSGFEDSAENEEDAAEKAINSLIRKEEVAQLLERLNEEEQRVIRLRFGLEDEKVHTLEEVGEKMDMSEERVRQIEQCAMGKLREAAGKKG